MYKFKCKEIGYHDDTIIIGETIDEVTQKVIDHAWWEHDIKAQTSKEVEEFIEIIQSKIQKIRQTK